jgi:ATP synthase protein I
MNGNPKDGNGGGDLSGRLRRLDEKLDALEARERQNRSVPAAGVADRSGIAKGLRFSAEIIGGAVTGFLIGWVFDRLTGLSPLGMIFFILLGFVAAIVNILRTANR